MPRKLVCTGKLQFEWQEFGLEPLKHQQVRVRSEFAAAKHGTEMALVKGYGTDRGPYDPELQIIKHDTPWTITNFNVGNMTVGRVEEAGAEVTTLKPGDRVCFFGGFRDVHQVDAAKCWAMTPDMPWQSAVCLDPAEFAMGAVRDGHVRIGDAAAVFGLGAIGLLVVQALRLAGAHPIIALDPIAHRREVAEQTGATLVLDPTQCDAGLEIKRATGNRGADVVIEYSGTVPAMNHALRGVGYEGTVVAGAWPPPYGAGLDFGAEAHYNLPRIVFSRACSQPDRDHPRWTEQRIFHTLWRMLQTGQMTGVPIVDPIVKPDELASAYADIATHPERSVKLGVAFA